MVTIIVISAVGCPLLGIGLSDRPRVASVGSDLESAVFARSSVDLVGRRPSSLGLPFHGLLSRSLRPIGHLFSAPSHCKIKQHF